MPLPDHESTFRSNIITTSFLEIFNIVVKVVLSIIIARQLGPAGRGEYALAFMIPGLFATLTAFGIGEASAALIGKDKYDRNKVFGCMATYTAAISFCVGALYYPLHGIIVSFVNGGISPHVYYLSFFLFVVQLIWTNISAVCLGLGIVKQIAYGRFLNNILFLGAILFLMFWGKVTPFITLALFILASTIELFYLHYFIKRQLKVTFCSDLTIMKAQLLFGLTLFWHNVFWSLNRRLDAYIVVYFMGNYSLGIYTIAVGICEFLLAVPTMVSRVTFSVSARSKGSEEGLSMTTASIRQVTFVMVAATVVLALCMKPLILIFYTQKFIEALVPALILLPGVIALGLSGMLGYILMGQSRPREQTFASGVACLLTVVLDVLLIPKYGIAGASLASTVAYTVSAGYLLNVYRNLVNRPLSDILIIKPEDIAGYRRDILSMFRKNAV